MKELTGNLYGKYAFFKAGRAPNGNKYIDIDWKTESSVYKTGDWSQDDGQMEEEKPEI